MRNGLLVLLLTSSFVVGPNCYAQQPEQKKVIAKEKVKEAGHAVSDYAYSEKEVFVEKTKNELIRFKKDLADMENKAKKASGNAKIEAQKKIEDAKSGIKKLTVQIETIKNATESQWNELKNKLNDSVDEVKDALAKSRKWLSEKIAP